MKKLKTNIAEVVRFIEEAHKILEEVSGTKQQNIMIKSADNNLVAALNDLTHLEETL